MLCAKKEDVVDIFRPVKQVSAENQAKKILKIFIFQDLIEKAKFSAVLDKFFLLM